MTDLTVWLPSQLDTDEALVRALPAVPSCAASNHARRYGLRTVAAHRAILERHEPYDVTARDDDGRIVVLAVCCSYCIGDVTTADNEPWPCPDVRDLLSIYEDRPGFDPSWKVET